MADIAQLDIVLRTAEAVAEGRRFEGSLDRIDTRARKAATAIDVLRQSLRDAGRQARTAATDFGAADAAMPRRGPGFAATAGLAPPVAFATAPLRTGLPVPVAPLAGAAGGSAFGRGTAIAGPETAAAATALRALTAEASAASAALGVLTLRATGARATAAPAAVAAPAVAAASVVRGRPAAPAAASFSQSRGLAGGFLGGPLAGIVAATGSIAIGAGLSGAVDEAGKLETAFNKIVGLAGESRDAIAGLKDEVLQLSAASGRGPQELAEALFFIESSGFKGAAALDVLKSSAAAARAGLGETKTIADAVTSAISTYGASNLSAGKATDILVAAVREGKGEADALAGVFGRVLPVSAALGVQLDETAGALAALTRTGLSADEAATAVRGAMAALLDPSKQASDAMAKFGLNAADLRQQIRDEGLLSGLMEIDTALGGNREALAQVFPEIRALIAVLSLLGENAETTAKVIAGVKDSVGATGAAVAAVADSIEDSLKRANASLDAAQVRIGEFAAPAKIAGVRLLASSIGVVASAAENLAAAFDSLGSTRIGAVTQGEVNALNAARDALRQGAEAADTQRTALESLATSALTAAAAFGTLRIAASLFGVTLGGPVAIAIAAAGAGLLALSDQLRQAKAGQDALRESLRGDDIERAYRAIIDIDAQIGETPIGELAKRSKTDLESLQKTLAEEQATIQAGQAARRAQIAGLAAQIEAERRARPGIDAAAGAFASGDIAGAGTLAGDDAGFLAAQRLVEAQSQLAKLQDQIQLGDAASLSFADALAKVGAALGVIEPTAAKGSLGVGTLTEEVSQANAQLETLRLRLEATSRVRAAQLLDAESQLSGGIGGSGPRVEAAEGFAESVKAIGDSQADAATKARALAAAEADLRSQLDAIARSEGIEAAARLQQVLDDSLSPAQQYQVAIADLRRDLALAAREGFAPTAEAIAEMEAQIRSNTLGVVDGEARLASYGEALAYVQQALAATETPSQRAARAVNELNAALATLERRGVTFDDATLKALEREVKNAARGIESFDQQVRSATQTSVRSFSEGISGAFVDTITGAQDAGDAFREFGARASAAILDVIAQILVMNAAASAIDFATGSKRGSELLGVEGLGGLFGSKPKADQGAAQQALAGASAAASVADPLLAAFTSGSDALAVAGDDAGASITGGAGALTEAGLRVGDAISQAVAAFADLAFADAFASEAQGAALPGAAAASAADPILESLLTGSDALAAAGGTAGDAITGSAVALSEAGASAAGALFDAISLFSQAELTEHGLGAAVGSASGLEGAAPEAAALEAAGTSAAGQIRDAITDGAGFLFDAGASLGDSIALGASGLLDAGLKAGGAIATGAGELLNAGLRAAAALIEAAVAAAGASSAGGALGFLGLREGGGVGTSPSGPSVVSLARVPALAAGGAVRGIAALPQRLHATLASGGAAATAPSGPILVSLSGIPALARGGYVPRLEEGGGLGPKAQVITLAETVRGIAAPRLSEGGAAALGAADGGSPASVSVSVAAPHAVAPPAALVASPPSWLPSRGDQQAQTLVSLAPALAAHPSGPPVVTALVGEAGPERLIHASQIAPALEAAGGDPIRAASLAKQAAVPLLAPEIRGLSVGDIVIPDRKLIPFFERISGRRPSAALATGGAVVPLHALASGGGVRRGESVPLSALGVDGNREPDAGLVVNVNLTQSGGGPEIEMRNVKARRKGASIDIVGELFNSNIGRGGSNARSIETRYGVQQQLRDPG